MLRILSVVSIAAVAGLVAWGVITLYDENLQVGRMWETPAIKPHEARIPVMDRNTVPFNGGDIQYRLSDPELLQSPIDIKHAQAVASGKIGYGRYCIQCHGKYHDGQGTVGQSFAPLPGDLRSTKVQKMPVGRFFHEISYGVPGGRQPALASTISATERWKIIGYVHSLGLRP